MRACSVWACNLCGTAGTWSVHLASVQRAAHRIMMTVAAASVFWGHERGRDSREKERRWGEKWRKKRVESTREQASYELGGVGCRKKRNKRGKGQRSFVFVLDYFCWVASVCSSCGQWIIQKKIKHHEFASLPVSVRSPALVRIANFLAACESSRIHLLWRLVTALQKTDTLQQQSAGWDLVGSSRVVTPFLHPVKL